MEDCIFCKIVRGEIPSTIIYENDGALAFEDIHPMAPVHVVVIPKKHIATLMDVTGDGMDTMGSIISAVQEVAKMKGVDEKGFRMVINCNEEGGQLVFHLHVHVLGGKRLRDGLD
jgi:histidine triad (HIT) family protein